MGIMDPFLSFNNNLTWSQSQPSGLCHLTLTNVRGDIIWESGERYAKEHPYISHFTDGMVAFDFISHESPRILVCGTKDGKGLLRIFDLDTGNLQQEIPLPRNDYTWVLCGKSDNKYDTGIIALTTQDLGYVRGGYGKHSVLFLNTEGSIIKEAEVKGDGHFPACFDADRDGLDEFMLGYDLFDHDGNHLWRAEHWHNRIMRPGMQHADQVYIYKEKDRNDWSAIIAGSDALYRIDSNGRTMWKKYFLTWGKRRRHIPWLVRKHVQFLCVGKLLPHNNNDYIFVLHNRTGMSLLNMNGKIFWQGKLPENWPGGRPDCIKTDSFHMGTPMILWRDALVKGEDLLIYNEAGWPYAINGRREKMVEFPFPPEARQPNIFTLPGLPSNIGQPPYRGDDWGYGYHCLLHDIDGDGQEEVLIYDRRFCWCYKMDPK